MAQYFEVIIHHNVGNQFLVKAENEDEALEIAMRRYTENGEDGEEILYDNVDRTEVEPVVVIVPEGADSG
jgi:hypothetical protein